MPHIYRQNLSNLPAPPPRTVYDEPVAEDGRTHHIRTYKAYAGGNPCNRCEKPAPQGFATCEHCRVMINNARKRRALRRQTQPEYA